MRNLYYAVFQNISDETRFPIAIFVDKLMAVEFAEYLMERDVGLVLSIQPIDQEDISEYF